MAESHDCSSEFVEGEWLLFIVVACVLIDIVSEEEREVLVINDVLEDGSVQVFGNFVDLIIIQTATIIDADDLVAEFIVEVVEE